MSQVDVFPLAHDPGDAAEFHPDTLIYCKPRLYTRLLALSVKRARLPEDKWTDQLDDAWIKWLAMHRDNFLWFAEFCVEMIEQYEARFRDEPHGPSEHNLEQALNNMPHKEEFSCHFMDGRTPFPRTFEQYEDLDTLDGYRQYLLDYKSDVCDWMDGAPEWASRLTEAAE